MNLVHGRKLTGHLLNAWHEASHAFIAHVHGIEVVGLSVEPQGDTAGRCRYAVGSEGLDPDVEIRCVLAGIMGEDLAFTRGLGLKLAASVVRARADVAWAKPARENRLEELTGQAIAMDVCDTVGDVAAAVDYLLANAVAVVEILTEAEVALALVAARLLDFGEVTGSEFRRLIRQALPGAVGI